MRISDWSSDVCSSDLLVVAASSAKIGSFPMEEGAAHWLFMRTPHAYTSGDSLLRCCKAHGGISRSDDHAHLPRDTNRASARSEEHTSELQSLMRISYAVFCLKKKKTKQKRTYTHYI